MRRGVRIINVAGVPSPINKKGKKHKITVGFFLVKRKKTPNFCHVHKHVKLKKKKRKEMKCIVLSEQI